MKRKGFTLIELLVVIAIIGMLSSIVLVSMGGARAKARNAKRQADLRQISTAMELAYDDSSAECGGPETYPTSSSTPPRICPTSGQYLNPFPPNVPPNNYVWVNNTSACTPSGSTTPIPAGQWYCVYVQLEGENVWFVASQTGTKKVTTNPGTQTPVCNCGIQ
jgi:prepilin-type N-terminal cleavage/methylation domain-containing protein